MDSWSCSYTSSKSDITTALLEIPDQPIGNGVAMGFEADYFDAAVHRIRQAEAQIVTDVHINPNAGHQEIWLRDLDGYLVVIAEPPADRRTGSA